MLNLFFNPSGRVSRTTWWVNSIIIAVVGYASYFVGLLLLASPIDEDGDPELLAVIGGLAAFVLAMVAFWCWLATSIKRLHDRDQSAWWMLLYLVPFIGGFVMWVMLGFLAGTEGPNRYGDYSI